MEAFRFATAIWQGNEEEVLRRLDADPSLLESGDHNGRGPFYTAAEARQPGVAKLLIQRGANVNGGGGKRTALHAAALFGHEDIGAFLLDHGAEAHTTDSEGATPLMLAADKPHVGMVKMLVEHMAAVHVESKDAMGRTALHYGTRRGKEDVVNALLDKGAQADSRDAKGETPLMVAAGEGHLGVLQILLQHMEGKGLEARDEEGRTALHLAAGSGHTELVAMLLSKGAQVNVKDKDGMTPLMRAINGDHMDVVQMLLEHLGGQGLEERNEHGRTALHIASGAYRQAWEFDDRTPIQIAAVLLSKGAHVNVKDKDGITPILMAIRARRVEMVRMLVEHMEGEGLEAKDEQGSTALHWAASSGDAELVTSMLRKGAPADIKDKDGMTPLMRVINKRISGYRMAVARLLLQHTEGEGLEARDKQGRTAMHLAARSGHTELVAMLLNKGAQANVKDLHGMTPLYTAFSAAQDHMAVVKMLLQHTEGEGLEARDEQGGTVLHLAARSGHAEVVTSMLSKGAQVDVKDKDGNTPLMVAIGRGYIEVARLLLQHTEGEGLEERDAEGRTAMHLASDTGRSHDILAFLLEHRATANVKDGNGVTPLMTAALRGSLTSVQLLVQHVGEQGLQERDQEGRTVLHYAIGGSATPLGATSLYYDYDGIFLAMVQALLEAGADPSITDKEGRTPRALAMEIGLQRCGRVCERGEDERRRYLLQRARCLHDTYATHQGTPGAPMPAFLQDRAAAGQALPLLELEGVQEEQQQAVLVYAVTQLNEQLFTELIGGVG